VATKVWLANYLPVAHNFSFIIFHHVKCAPTENEMDGHAVSWSRQAEIVWWREGIGWVFRETNAWGTHKYSRTLAL